MPVTASARFALRVTLPVLLAAGVVIAARLVAGQAGAPANRIRIAMGGPASAQQNGAYVWIRAFADALEREGMLTTVYPSATLGSELERSDQVRSGLLHVNESGGQELADISPLYRAASMPFLWEDYDAYDKFLHVSGGVDLINTEIEPKGFRMIDSAFVGGMVGLFNRKKPVSRLEDLVGIRLRAMERTQISYISAWGGHGTQVAWEEVSQALQTGVVDGYLNPPVVATLFSHTLYLKHFTNLRMLPSERAITVSAHWYGGLNDRERAVVDAAIEAARLANRAFNRGVNADELAALERAGVRVTEISPEARSRWAARSMTVYASLSDPASIARVRSLVEAGNQP